MLPFYKARVNETFPFPQDDDDAAAMLAGRDARSFLDDEVGADGPVGVSRANNNNINPAAQAELRNILGRREEPAAVEQVQSLSSPIYNLFSYL